MDDNVEVKITASTDGVDAAAAAAATAITDATQAMTTAINALNKTSAASAVRIAASMAKVGAASTAAANSVSVSMVQAAAAMQTMSAAASTAGTAAVTGLGKISQAATTTTHAAAGVRREFLVLGHEILTGNWTRFGGSLLVLGERMDILSKVMSPVGLGVLGIAVALAGLAVAAVEGARELEKLQNNMVLTGNASGLTAAKYYEMADAIKASQNVSAGTAGSAVGATAASGLFGPQATQAVATAVAKISQLSGENATKVLEDFAKMNDGVYKWAETNRLALDTISQAQAEHARTLEETGNKEQAEVYIAQAVTSALNDMSGQLQKTTGFWEGLGNAVSSVWSRIKRDLAGVTPQDTLTSLQNAKAGLTADKSQGRTSIGNNTNIDVAIASIDRQIAAQQKLVDSSNQLAKSQAEVAEQNRVGKQNAEYFDGTLKATHGQVAQMEILNRQIATYNAHIAESKRLGQPFPSAAEQAEYIKTLTDAATKKSGPKAKTESPGAAFSGSRADAQGEIALVKDKLGSESAELERGYKANTIDLQTYYTGRLKITEQGLDAEINAVKKELEAAQGAASKAKTPDQRDSAQATEARVGNQLLLLEQQRVEAVAKVTEEYEDQLKVQQNQLAVISINSGEQAAQAQITRAKQMTDSQVAMGKLGKKQQLQDDINYENQSYQIALQSLQQKAALDNLSLTQKSQLLAQELALEQDHATKLNQLNLETAQAQQQANQTATKDVTDDFTTMLEKITSGQETLKNVFKDTANSLFQQINKIMAQKATQQLFGGGSGGSSGGGLLGGGLQSLLSAIGLGGSGSGSGSNSFANAFSMPGASTGSSSMGGLGGIFGSIMQLFGGGSGGSSSGQFTGSFQMPGAGGGDSGGLFGIMAGLGNLIPMYAKGTNYVPNTQMALLHRGEAVVPANYNNGGSPSKAVNVIQNFTGTQNQDRRTQGQIAAQAGWGIQRALKRNG